jgi:hypothetical protein
MIATTKIMVIRERHHPVDITDLLTKHGLIHDQSTPRWVGEYLEERVKINRSRVVISSDDVNQRTIELQALRIADLEKQLGLTSTKDHDS